MKKYLSKFTLFIFLLSIFNIFSTSSFAMSSSKFIPADDAYDYWIPYPERLEKIILDSKQKNIPLMLLVGGDGKEMPEKLFWQKSPFDHHEMYAPQSNWIHIGLNNSAFRLPSGDYSWGGKRLYHGYNGDPTTLINAQDWQNLASKIEEENKSKPISFYYYFRKINTGPILPEIHMDATDLSQWKKVVAVLKEHDVQLAAIVFEAVPTVHVRQYEEVFYDILQPGGWIIVKNGAMSHKYFAPYDPVDSTHERTLVPYNPTFASQQRIENSRTLFENYVLQYQTAQSLSQKPKLFEIMATDIQSVKQVQWPQDAKDLEVYTGHELSLDFILRRL